MRFSFVLPLLLAACASSPPRATLPPAAASADIHFDDFDLHEVEKRWARISVDCAQAVVLEVPAKGLRWGEAVWVFAHSDHDVVGQIEFDTGLGGKTSTSFKTKNTGSWSIDDSEQSKKCDDNITATAPPGVSGTSSAGSTPNPSGSPTPATPEARVDIGFTFDASITADPRPPKFLFRHEFQHTAWSKGSFDAPPLGAGTKIRIRFWGMKSIDWSGFVFSVHHYELKPKDPVAWRGKLDAELAVIAADEAAQKAKVDAWNAHANDCVKRPKDPDCAGPPPWSNSSSTSSAPPSTPQPSTSTGTPPPPAVAETQSPKPSDGATWVSGRWVWDGFKWSFWSKGFWRIPESDRDGKHTPTAPKLPPPPKAETQPPMPIPGAVWTPGYWHWNVSVWLWVDGAWRVPPIAGAKWKPFVWRVEASGTVRLDPGGWLSP